MYNKIIQVNVSKEKIEILNEIEYISIENSVNYIKLEMTFNDVWNEFEYKYVVFKNGKTKVKCLVGDDNSCYVPSEVIKVPNFAFSLLIENDVQRITTNVIYIPVEHTISLEDAKDKEETQLLYNQINTLVNISKDNIKELEEYIKNMNVQVDLSEVLADLDVISNKIDNIDVNVDFSEVLSEIDNVEDNILILQNKVDNISIEVDFTEVLNSIKTTQSMIQSLISSNQGQFSQVLSNTNNIPSIITSLNQIKNILDTIPTNDYTSELQSIKDILDTIPTNDYTNDINTIVHELTDVGTQGTIANNTKWSLTRAEECKSISQQCYQLLTDVTLKLDEF